MTKRTTLAWQNPGSPWHRTMRRRAAMYRLVGFGGLVMAAVMLVVLLWVHPIGLDMPWWIAVIMFAGLMTAPIAMLGGALIGGLRLARTRRLVPQHAAMVCPSCIRPSAQDGELIRCTRCGRSASAADLTDYWQSLANDRVGATDWRTAYSGRQPQRSQVLATPLRRAMFWLLCFTLFLFVFSIATGRSSIGTTLKYLPVILFVIGFKLVAPTRRTGNRQCAACGYGVAPDAPPERCAECAADLTLPAALVHGRAPHRRRTAIAGIVLIALAGLAFLNQAVSIVPLRRVIPTSLLVQELASEGASIGAWAELRRREVSAEQHRQLVEQLLERTDLSTSLWTPARNWLTNEFVSGSLPPDLADRFFDEVHSVEVYGIADVANDELRIMLRFTGPPIHAIYTQYGTLHVDDRVVPDFIPPEPSQPWSIRHVATTELGGTGRRSVRWPFLLVIANPIDLMEPIQFGTDGQPVLPRSTVWSKQMVLTAEVEVP